MLIKLINNETGNSIQFMGYDDVVNLFGFTNTLPYCYPKFVNENLIFIYGNPAGFFGNPQVNPYSIKGAGEDGVNFKANNFNSRLISFNFRNVFEKTEGNIYNASPNNILQSVIMADNDTINVEVTTTSETYVNTFFVTDATDLEKGVITLESALGGINGITWSNGVYDYINYYFSNGNPYISKKLPKVLLKDKSYPINLSYFTNVKIKPKITIGGNNTLWELVTLIHIQGDNEFTYTNLNNDKIIIIDCENETIKNSSGDDRSSNFTGSFFELVEGINNFNWLINLENEKHLPLDFHVKFEYEKKVWGIEYES